MRTNAILGAVAALACAACGARTDIADQIYEFGGDLGAGGASVGAGGSVWAGSGGGAGGSAGSEFGGYAAAAGVAGSGGHAGSVNAGGAAGRGGFGGTPSAGGSAGAAGSVNAGGAAGRGGFGGTPSAGGSAGAAGSVNAGGAAGRGGFGGTPSAGGSAGAAGAGGTSGLLGILPGVSATPACVSCVNSQCGTFSTCSNDPGCTAGLTCTVDSCLNLRRRQANACLLKCFQNDGASAMTAVIAADCVYTACASGCTGG